MAAGNGCCGAKRYPTEKHLPPVKRARVDVVERHSSGLPWLQSTVN